MEATTEVSLVVLRPKHAPAETIQCQIYYNLLRVAVGGIIAVLGLIGNAITMVIMKQERKKSSTVLALMYLAASDFMVVLVYGGVNWSSPFASFTSNKKLPLQVKMYSAAYFIPLGQVFNFISVSITVIVIWQRYVSVCIPLKVKTYVSNRKVHIQVLTVSISAVLFYLPTLFIYEIRPKSLTRRHFAENESFSIFYEIVLTYTLSYFMPITALIFMAVGLIRTLKKLKFHSKEAQNRSETAKHEMTMSLVVIVIVFIVCQSFAPVRRVLQWLYDPYSTAQMCGQELFYFAPFEILSVLFNSSANFFIFVLCARGFRKKVFGFCKRDAQVGTYRNVSCSDG
uniref:G-protein coupled receptors family 1 profile domain-containing protein n=1 Tax=Capitella teleta TaxID=283909 RepID=X2A7W7_CAPTE